jgi:hypothetical protein
MKLSDAFTSRLLTCETFKLTPNLFFFCPDDIYFEVFININGLFQFLCTLRFLKSKVTNLQNFIERILSVFREHRDRSNCYYLYVGELSGAGRPSVKVNRARQRNFWYLQKKKRGGEKREKIAKKNQISAANLNFFRGRDKFGNDRV